MINLVYLILIHSIYQTVMFIVIDKVFSSKYLFVESILYIWYSYSRLTESFCVESFI
jgi:hypothetical protein